MRSFISSQDPAPFTHHRSSDHNLLSVHWYNRSFEIRKPFGLPMPNFTVSVEELLSTIWMSELKEILSNWPTKSCNPITLLIADHKYRAALVNWMVTSSVVVQPPVNNILVLSLDKYLYELLKYRRISCIHIDPTTIMVPKFKHRPTPIPKAHAMIIEMTVMRFINHWGFDIDFYDVDALIMRSPLTIYQRYSGADIIISTGFHPHWIERIWGFTVCTGVILIRSSPQTGEWD